MRIHARLARAAVTPLVGLALALLVAAALAAPAFGVPASGLSGRTRYDTAVAISRASFPATSTSVVIANGAAWADALGGSSLAGVADGPILITERNAVPDAIARELKRLSPGTIYLLGGPNSLSATLEARVRALVPAAGVVRLGGRDRYAVAARVASETAALRGEPVGLAFVVTGATFADALSCSPVAAANGWPVYLVHAQRPLDFAVAAMRRDGVTDVVIAGGTASVPAAFESALRREFGTSHVRRISGGDRYAVSVGVGDFAVAHAGFDWSDPTFASGVVPADALCGGPFSGRRAAPVLLLAADRVPDPVAARLFAHREDVASLTFFGGQMTVPDSVRIETQHALKAPAFSKSRAMAHVEAIAGFGPRAAGGTAERKAADYVAAQLRTFGYTVTVQTGIPIPGGRTTRNVIAEKTGSAPGVIVLGAHMDSKPPSPGANDNASGVGVVLELARILAQADGLVPTVRFIAFGAEEISGATSSDHHFGSRYYVGHLPSAGNGRIESMVSVDMVGYGDTFNVRNLGEAAMTTVASLRKWAWRSDQALPYLADPSSTGWSDHEAFEFAGIPAAWLEWREDPRYHTARDVASHVQPDKVLRTGRLLRGWLLGISAEELGELRP